MTDAEEKLYGVDAKELLARWDEGESIWSLTMGGIGPGYEQAIQILAVELTREALLSWYHSPKPTEAEVWAKVEPVVRRIDPLCGGFSGAQVGAARKLSWWWLSKGPAWVQQEAKRRGEDDRCILVSRTFPRAPEAPPRGFGRGGVAA